MSFPPLLEEARCHSHPYWKKPDVIPTLIGRGQMSFPPLLEEARYHSHSYWKRPYVIPTLTGRGQMYQSVDKQEEAEDDERHRLENLILILQS
jgi:hypothetical protein